MQHRALFLSDMHLGTRMARPDLILRFLTAHRAETVYLVGDIVDAWHPLGRNWRPDHHAVLRHLLDLPVQGVRVVFLPGNHDAVFRAHIGRSLGGIAVRHQAVHRARDGRRYLVTHGDCCDIFATRAPLLSRAGSLIEKAARALDAAQRRALAPCGLGGWQGIGRAIRAVQAAIRRHDRFEDRLRALAAARGLDGVICGHFHQPALHVTGGLTYANCGDWTGSNTAIAEGFDGRLTLLSGDAVLPADVAHATPGSVAWA